MSKLTEQQLAAVTSVDSHVLVPAGAGSGKTHVLVERFLEILKRYQELTVSNVVAVTYTKKAANEMRTRLKAALEQLAQTSEGAMKERWQRCRSEIDAARIGTIHSLCESILKAFPAEAQIDPQFEVLNELELAEFLRLSIDQALLEVVQEQSDEVELLAKYPVEHLREWLESMIKSGPQLQEALGKLPGLDEHQLMAHCRLLLQDWQADVVKAAAGRQLWTSSIAYLKDNPLKDRGNRLNEVIEPVLQHAQAVNECFAQLMGHAEDGRQLLVPAVQALQNMHAIIKLNVGGNKDEVKALKEELRQLRSFVGELVKNLPCDLSDGDRLAFVDIKRLVALQSRVWGIFAGMKKSQQRLDFNDLIQFADQLLDKDNSLARRYYHETVAAILVDEFQDTNRTQAKLIANLAGPDTRLFLIGDDKQSIYKFQGADVSTFNQWRSQLQSGGSASQVSQPLKLNGGSQVLILNRSFRSHPAIVGLVNLLFNHLLQDSDEKSYRAVYHPLEANRQSELPDTRIEAIFYDELNEHGKRAEDADLLEAQAVVNWMREKMSSGAQVFDKHLGANRNMDWGDFAILTQRNDDFPPFEKILSAAEIPYVLMGGSGFLRKQEIYDLENLLRFLASTVDSQSLLGVLRSPLLGIPDDVLHHLSVDSKGSTLWQRLQDSAATSGDQVLSVAVRQLQQWLMSAGRKPLPELLREIIQGSNYDAVLMLRTGGRQASRNIWKLVQLANENAQLSISEFVESLEAMRDFKVKQTAAPVDAENSVKLMTIHSSKGLEFPAVALPKLSSKAVSFKGKLHFHREYGLAFDHTRDDNEDSPAHFLVAKHIEADMAIAEKKRLLYVAMTRARDYLGMFMEEQGNKSDSFRNWIEDFLHSQPISELDSHCRQFHKSREDIAFDAGQFEVVSKTAPDLADLAGSFELMTDLSAPTRPPRPRWQSLLRVTPSASKSAIEPTVLGDCFHKVMEYYCATLNLPDADMLQTLVQSDAIAVVHPQMSQLLLSELEHLLQCFQNSELQTLMQEAKVRLPETPYMILEQNPAPTSKRPDLLLQDCLEQWHVIDYKTDHIAESEIVHQANDHRKQLSTYLEHIELITGVKPTASVYFAQLGQMCRL